MLVIQKERWSRCFFQLGMKSGGAQYLAEHANVLTSLATKKREMA